MVVGYLIGSISSAIIVSKSMGHGDIREKGSGNAGATNTLRNLGKKAGAIVFLMDIMKPIVAILLGFIFNKIVNDGDWNAILPLIGVAAIVGHIYPIYFKFKGGKGAASMLGFMIALYWPLALFGAAIFLTIVLTTRKVSLGSIVSPVLLIIIYILMAGVGDIRDNWIEPLMNGFKWWVNALSFVTIWLLVVYSHRGNIQRLLNGTERSLSFGSSEPKQIAE